ncbi:MAG: hydroxyacid dehydrogenase [Alphaproteobacteria bacterium]|nr:hydroxyacid dehydrogenase [Alphaproteobacteria bacterium]
MRKVIFFDADSDLCCFMGSHPIDNTEIVCMESSLNKISLSKLVPYLDAEIISVFTHSDVLSNHRLSLFPNLKMIATRSTGTNHLDMKYMKKHKITITNVPYYGAQTVAEFAFALILNLSRRVLIAQQDMSHNQIHIPEYVGFDLYGKTIGIIGTGSIGRHMIRLAQGFGMRVLAYDLYPNKELKHLYVPLSQLYKESDIISLHIPSTPKNHHILNKTAFRQMKRGVYIINTARGDLIDTAALYEAVKGGKVAGAGLDVLENEDILIHDDISFKDYSQNTQFLLDSAINLKLLQHPHIIATPHIAFNTRDALLRIMNTTFENIKNFIQKTNLPTPQ